jgi:hypothetical protein
MPGSTAARWDLGGKLILLIIIQIAIVLILLALLVSSTTGVCT